MNDKIRQEVGKNCEIFSFRNLRRLNWGVFTCVHVCVCRLEVFYVHLYPHHCA